MRLLDLSLKNIGPFDDAKIAFFEEGQAGPAVTLLTGENGTGKSIVLDAIRGMFGPSYVELERPLWRANVPFEVVMHVAEAGVAHAFRGSTRGVQNNFLHSEVPHKISTAADRAQTTGEAPNWVLDFWRTVDPAQSYAISNLVTQNHREYLKGALQGKLQNASVTALICYFDYLRDSRDERERAAGEALYATTERIIEASLLHGRLLHVERATFTPIVEQSGQRIPLGNVSSGNAYLIQHMISMLGKMYAVHVLRGTDPSELCTTPGVLLIDEAENHFHPRWQKRFIPNVLKVFPNLQVIATTHSPFIVASVPGARVYVCRYDAAKRSCVIDDETAAYEDKPVEEILLSPAFDETQPFGDEITRLLDARKAAIAAGDAAKQRELEAELKERNPEYFAYLDIDQKLDDLEEASK